MEYEILFFNLYLKEILSRIRSLRYARPRDKRANLHVHKNECLFCSSLKAESLGGFGCCPFYGGVSTVVYSLFVVAPIGVWSLFDFAVLCILSSRRGRESWLLF